MTISDRFGWTFKLTDLCPSSIVYVFSQQMVKCGKSVTLAFSAACASRPHSTSVPPPADYAFWSAAESSTLHCTPCREAKIMQFVVLNYHGADVDSGRDCATPQRTSGSSKIPPGASVAGFLSATPPSPLFPRSVCLLPSD